MKIFNIYANKLTDEENRENSGKLEVRGRGSGPSLGEDSQKIGAYLQFHLPFFPCFLRSVHSDLNKFLSMPR